MLVSVVIITKDEAPRLRLVLESFAAQRLDCGPGAAPLDMEVVVVDDGSSDETATVLDEAASRLRLSVVRHRASRGRSSSRNAGVQSARGEVIILFDGDCLASPELVARHAAAHAARPNLVGRGETYHLRCTRFFRDPETGSPMPGLEERAARAGDEVRRALVTRDQIRFDFASIVARGEPGIYAGAGPRRLYELEMRALRCIPEASILWMTAPGQNVSIRRADFLAVGGFHPELTINEHRELVFRLYQRGHRIRPVEGARSFHMLHRTGWRDPIEDVSWERQFYAAHPCLATKLMNIFWLSLAGDKQIPEEARILSLEQLEAVATGASTFDYDSLRRAHPRLAVLGG
jgi:glycosyltransferase involved in cell wall biosynthesis